jgi:CTP synthase (UTP-ammonia lyase)
VTPLACSLHGRDDRVALLPGTRAALLYGSSEATESYRCNYGLSPAWERRLEQSGLRVTARGPEGEARMVELEEHPFFVATLFLPQMRSTPDDPHPILRAFVEATTRPSGSNRRGQPRRDHAARPTPAGRRPRDV